MRRALDNLRDAGFSWGKLAVSILFILVFLMLFTGASPAGEPVTNNSGGPYGADAEDVTGLATLGMESPLYGQSSHGIAASDQVVQKEDALIPGDILVGRCELSPVPSLNPAQGWTHSCIYIGDGQIIVATQPGVGVIKSSLRSWMYPDMTWVAYLRVTSANQETRAKAIEFALSKKGLPYDLNWLSKQPDGDSWYCSELVWAAYLNASDGSIDLVRGPDLFGISPDEIYMSEHTMVIGGHYERKPDTILSLLMKVLALCVLIGGTGIGVETVVTSRRRRKRGQILFFDI